ncbi:MAG: helix-hairpin-helix domain-containing protein [Bacteroidales bacterium]|nr:helix-hairpin-helix domain-containing protein [Bacteroidales bacterium]
MNNFLTFTKGERVAIIVLAAVIFFIIAANFFIANRPANVKNNLQNLDSIMALHEAAIEELKTTRQQDNKTTSEVTETPSHQVTKSYKETRNNINKKVQQPKANSISSKALVQKPVKLNSADTTELKSLPGIGSFFAKNIVDYRNKLGGFIEKEQLLEVYAFDSTRMSNIENLIIIDSIELRRININTDDFKTILRHPYIEYEDVKNIVNYRESKGMIKNWEQYLKVVGRNDIDERLEWYLSF